MKKNSIQIIFGTVEQHFIFGTVVLRHCCTAPKNCKASIFDQVGYEQCYEQLYTMAMFDNTFVIWPKVFAVCIFTFKSELSHLPSTH